jgi:NAD(P)-dependent dehydrogenase (short-subunit alcohol dehydrogenase family)
MAARASGGNCVCQRADVSQREQVEAAVRAAVQRFGKIDVLVNDAAYSRGMTTDISACT